MPPKSGPRREYSRLEAMRKVANSESAGQGEPKDPSWRFPSCPRNFDLLSDSGKFLLLVALLLVMTGGLTMQAYGASCREARRIRIVYWNDLNTGHPAAAADLKARNEWAFHGSCGPVDMYGYGDYDRDHHWHDSDWWMGHDRDWVQHHHPNWVTESEHHDKDHGHDHDQGHGHDHDNH